MNNTLSTVRNLAVSAALCAAASTHAADISHAFDVQVEAKSGWGTITPGLYSPDDHSLSLGNSASGALMHTDVPDLPRGGTNEPLPGFGSFTPGGLVPDSIDPRSKPNPILIDTSDLVRGVMMAELGFDPRGGLASTTKPGRIHTDVPDLPGLSKPSVSHTPPTKPGGNEWSDDLPGRPQLESATIPAPASMVVFGLGCGLMVRRRR